MAKIVEARIWRERLHASVDRKRAESGPTGLAQSAPEAILPPCLVPKSIDARPKLSDSIAPSCRSAAGMFRDCLSPARRDRNQIVVLPGIDGGGGNLGPKMVGPSSAGRTGAAGLSSRTGVLCRTVWMLFRWRDRRSVTRPKTGGRIEPLGPNSGKYPRGSSGFDLSRFGRNAEDARTGAPSPEPAHLPS